MIDDLTEEEQSLMSRLPAPPPTTTIRASNIWIVEWLPESDAHTGRSLHEWMLKQRRGWSQYFLCGSKTELLAAIEKAHDFVGDPQFSPVLHIEAHGSEIGLEGPNGAGGSEWLIWSELTPFLQKLNLATRCNLVVVVAACIGFAAIQALISGPRAPAIALVGPDANVNDSDLLRGTKEFYRRWQDPNPGLTEIAESASLEMGVKFEIEPFALLAYEVQVAHLIRSRRPSEQTAQKDRIRKRLLAETHLSAVEVEARFRTMPTMLTWRDWQQIWDEMFMIDLFPENRERFGVDWKSISIQLPAGVKR